jgi:hypothetical protein
MTEKKGNKTLHTTKLQARRKAILSIAASVWRNTSDLWITQNRTPNTWKESGGSSNVAFNRATLIDFRKRTRYGERHVNSPPSLPDSTPWSSNKRRDDSWSPKRRLPQTPTIRINTDLFAWFTFPCKNVTLHNIIALTFNTIIMLIDTHPNLHPLIHKTKNLWTLSTKRGRCVKITHRSLTMHSYHCDELAISRHIDERLVCHFLLLW